MLQLNFFEDNKMQNVHNSSNDASFGANAIAGANTKALTAVKNTYHFEAFDPEGNLKWEETIENLVTSEGLNDLLDNYLKGAAYTASFFVLLTDGTPTPAAGDTLASHAGWVEVTAYTGDRQALVLGTVTGQSVDNSASKAVFPITSDATTIGGAGLSTVATGTVGVLYSVAAFTAADKLLDNGDTLNVTVTCTAASA